MLAYAIGKVAETPTSYKCCLCKTSNFAGEFGQLIWTIVHVCILFDRKVLFDRDRHLLVATVRTQFFAANTNLRTPTALVDFECCLLLAVTKFHQMTNLQVHSNLTVSKAKISYKFVVPTCVWYDF